jgi:UDP-glucose 4-epimerase
MRVLVTGAAGFIGSHLCDRLLAGGHQVCGVDNFHLGKRRNITHLGANQAFDFVELDVLDGPRLDALFAAKRFEEVFHLAANSDIAAGNGDPGLDLRLNQITTNNVLAAMKNHGAVRLFFASTSAVFGEQDKALAENDGPLQPISFYGASKLAAEAYISTYAHTLGLRAVILRFPNIVGERATHGALFDFIEKLKRDPAQLPVLGDGRQTKPYLYVADLLDAIELTWARATEPLEVFHAAGEGATTVRRIAETAVTLFGRPDTKIIYSGGDRGWPGDVPRFSYNTGKLRALGWRPIRDSDTAIRLSAERILANGF